MPLKGTLTGSYGTGIMLDGAHYTNPVTVTGTISLASVGIGLQAVTVWSIFNQGNILGPNSASAYGISLAAGGYISNASGGLINANSGINIASNAGTVVNGGSISGNSGAAISLTGGGIVTNQAGAVVTDVTGAGIYATGVAASVINSGSIVDTGTAGNGIDLLAGGYVSNATTGTIGAAAHSAIVVEGGPGSLVNDGQISSGSRASVALFDGGDVSNQANGVIVGASGVYFKSVAGTVFNAGTITAASGNGVYLMAGGSVDNVGGGAISISNTDAHAAVYIGGLAGTVTNAGLIDSPGGKAGVDLGMGGSLTNETGGTISGGGTGHSEIYVAGAAGTVTNLGLLTGGSGVHLHAGGTVINRGTIGGTIAYAGVFVTNASGVVINSGVVGNINLSAGGSVTNQFGGTIASVFVPTSARANVIIDPGAVFTGSVSGGDPDGGALEFGSGASAGTLTGIGSQFTNFGSLAFDSGASWLVSGSETGWSGTIAGFASTDTIEITGLTTTGSSFSNGALTLTGSGGVGSATLDFADNFSLPDFSIADVGGDTAVTLNQVCFCAGTLIMTPDGEVQVEHLQVGDKILTAGGVVRPIVWIGTGRVLAPRSRRTAAAIVSVRKGALSDNVPHRDLRMTKGHSLYLDGVLVPVELLVNHRSIVWDTSAREAKIYHIELDTHDVLIANGALAESYRDDGNRYLFQNANSGWHLPQRQPCAPVLSDGPLVDAAWERLLDRSGPRKSVSLTDDPDLHLLVDGKRLDAIERRDGTHVFRLTAKPRSVRVVSHAAAPQELGLARDPRTLGVAVRQLVLVQPRRQRVIAAAASSLMDGYHAYESVNNLRWTNGDAAAPPELFAGMAGPGMLLLHLGAATKYLDEGRARKAA